MRVREREKRQERREKFVLIFIWMPLEWHQCSLYIDLAPRIGANVHLINNYEVF